MEEQIVQKFPHRCPYCEEEVSYEAVALNPGENELVCPSCRRTYIKVILDGSHPFLSAGRAPKRRRPSLSRRGQGKKARPR
ncbi:MAG: hypothetical protein N3G78_09445 [Desulfobacterota bacterium]|nr:hypothetical protein [Thermodesulfobacteriota bacterium]